MELFKKLAEYTEVIYGGGGMGKQIMNAFKSKIFDKHQGENWSSNFNTLSEGLSIDAGSIAKQYLEHFAFQNNGDLSTFKKKDAHFLREHMINSIEGEVQVWLSRDGMKSVRNPSVTQHVY